MELWQSVTTFIVFFLLGYWTADYEDGICDIPEDDNIESVPKSSWLQRQKNAHKEFQATIREIQHPPEECRRILRLEKSISPVGANPYEEFARAFQYLALSLQVAVATRRSLVIDEKWALLPGDREACRTYDDGLRSISCLRIKSKCDTFDPENTIHSPPTYRSILEAPASSFAIIPDTPITKTNNLFHAEFYGPDPVMEMPSWFFPKDTYLIDVVPQWERAFGRFWIRSQVSHYAWEEWHGPSSLSQSESASGCGSPPTIAFYWISCKKLRRNLAVKFGRNATFTQSFERYMETAATIQKEYDEKIRQDSCPPLKNIVVVTDRVNDVPIPALTKIKKQYPDWEFSFPSLSGATAEQQMLSDLHQLRTANYLVGTFQSQMYRLAAQLNLAYFHRHDHPTVSTPLQRHWPVDVEWFENP